MGDDPNVSVTVKRGVGYRFCEFLSLLGGLMGTAFSAWKCMFRRHPDKVYPTDETQPTEMRVLDPGRDFRKAGGLATTVRHFAKTGLCGKSKSVEPLLG